MAAEVCCIDYGNDNRATSKLFALFKSVVCRLIVSSAAVCQNFVPVW